MRERRFGSFERALRISDTVDADKIEASFKKGVLQGDASKDRRCAKAGQDNRSEG
jgi:HSP20 family protein